jgi:hypothetical protein
MFVVICMHWCSCWSGLSSYRTGVDLPNGIVLVLGIGLFALVFILSVIIPDGRCAGLGRPSSYLMVLVCLSSYPLRLSRLSSYPMALCWYWPIHRSTHGRCAGAGVGMSVVISGGVALSPLVTEVFKEFWVSK